MHILLLREGFYPKLGGGSIEQWNVAKSLVARGHEVTVFAPQREGAPRYERVEGVEIHRPYRAAEHLEGGPTSALGFLGRLAYAVLVCVALVRWLRTTDVDVVVSASHLTHPAAKFLSVRYGLPVVTYMAYTPTMDPKKRTVTNPSYLLEQVNFRLFLGDRVRCRTPDVKAAVERHTDAPVALIHGILDERDLRAAVESVDAQAVRARYGVGDDEYLLLFVGRFISVKNPTKAVGTIARLPDRFKLVMLGDGPLRESVAIQRESKQLAGRVTIAGEVAHEEVIALMLAADGLLVTSRTEAYPTVVFEALALGAEVFATPVGVLPELTQPRLHLAAANDPATTIATAAGRGRHAVDDATLAAYSMDRYVDHLLADCASLVAVEQPTPPARPDLSTNL
ncbi:glycosyltransferase family 4 protein [Haladaptatus sp. GCM10025893]|uniref:glycosyltransferase family 4 protein n=1 Tax=Haladaptatus sp. GCM10025893 TaxID=3252659 RepID=UPI00361614F5